MTSLADERMHGSLDVLLTTPLSTRSILIGEMGRCFSDRSQVALAPAVTSLLIACDSGRWFKYLLLSRTSAGIQRHDRQHGLGAGNLAKPAGARGGFVHRGLHHPFDRLAGPGVRSGPGNCSRERSRDSSAHFWFTALRHLVRDARAFPVHIECLATLSISGLEFSSGLRSTARSPRFSLRSTVATFDRCLGRVPETDPPDYSGRWSRRMSEFNRPFDDENIRGLSRPARPRRRLGRTKVRAAAQRLTSIRAGRFRLPFIAASTAANRSRLPA